MNEIVLSNVRPGVYRAATRKGEDRGIVRKDSDDRWWSAWLASRGEFAYAPTLSAMRVAIESASNRRVGVA